MTQINSTRQPVSSILTRNIWFLDKVMPIANNRLDATTKMVTFGISQEFIRMGVSHSQLTKIWYPNVADNAGLSQESVVSGVSKLAKAQAITKETKYIPCGPTKEKKKRTFIAFTPLFLTNPALVFSEVQISNHGGKRESIRCPHCDEYHPLKQRSTITCSGCGSVIEELTKVVTLDNAAPTPEVRTDEERQVLARLDELIEATDTYYDAAEIDDEAVEAMGGAEKALAASPREIAEVMKTPYVIRKYGEDAEELLDAAWDVMADMKNVIPLFPLQTKPKPDDENTPDNPTLFDAM
jgi:hypothetical protein